MAPRAQWNGYLRLSLVSCPVSLYPAVTPAERISFRQVNRETGHRLRQQLVDTVTGDVVESHNRGRGYEVGQDQFVVVPDEDLEAAQREARTRPFSEAPRAEPEEDVEPPSRPALKLVDSRRRADPEPPPEDVAAQAEPVPRPIVENTHIIELDRFIPRDEIDARYFLAPYYIVPRDASGMEAFAVIREAMANEKLVGMGRVVLTNRERPLIVEPMGLGLRGFTLHYAHEVRPERDYFADIPRLELPADMLEVTELILNSKRGQFDVSYLEDRYRTVLAEKLREKQLELPVKGHGPAPSARNVINLMEALKASLAASKPPAPSKARAGSKGTTAGKRPAAQKSIRKKHTG
jgi:DNA end-binding protein Ku